MNKTTIENTIYGVSLRRLRDIVRHLAHGRHPAGIAARQHLNLAVIQHIATDYGWPDLAELTRSSQDLEQALRGKQNPERNPQEKFGRDYQAWLAAMISIYPQPDPPQHHTHHDSRKTITRKET